MAYTQADLDRIEAAIATGTMRITHNGKTTEFRSLDDMIRVRDMIRKSVKGPNAGGQHRAYAPTFDRGYQ